MQSIEEFGIAKDDQPLVILANQSDPMSSSPTDGYGARVLGIDHGLNTFKRVYVKFAGKNRTYDTFKQVDDNCFILEIGSFDIARSIIQNARGVYCHSIYPLNDPRARALMGMRKCPFILDLHGIVPEEVAFLQGASQPNSFDALECWAALSVDAMVFVTDKMRNHFYNKYNWSEAQSIVCPMFALDNKEIKKSFGEQKTVVYSGGAQLWQKVELIIKLIAKRKKDYKFVVISRDKSFFEREINSLIGDNLDGRVTILSCSPDEISDHYRSCDFGLALRDDTDINRVACPTKLVEYLANDIVPVLLSSDIGDFAELGLCFISYDDLFHGHLPSQETMVEMIINNSKVRQELQRRSESGIEIIKSLFSK